MRSKNRNMLVAFVAMLAVGALATSSASAALPEFSPAGGVSFTIKGGGGIFHSTSSFGEFGYRSLTGSGVITGAKEVGSVKITLTPEQGPFVCESGEGKLVTVTLKGRLGYTNKEKHEVGLLLEPASGSVVATCKNGTEGPEEYRGSWIGAVTPLNKAGRLLDLGYLQSGGLQKLQKFEGELLGNHNLFDHFGAGTEARMAQEGTLELEDFQTAKKEAVTVTVLG